MGVSGSLASAVPVGRRFELDVGSALGRRGARGARRIQQGAPGRRERVSPLSLAGVLAEVPNGLVRLCEGCEGPDNRPVVPLVNDRDAPFFHRPASSFDKLAHAQGPNSPLDHPSRDYSYLPRISSAEPTAAHGV